MNSPARYQPLDLRQKLGLKEASRLEPLRHFASQQQALGGEVHQHVPDDLPQVHAADHLLVPAGKSEPLDIVGNPSRRLEYGSVDGFSQPG